MYNNAHFQSMGNNMYFFISISDVYCYLNKLQNVHYLHSKYKLQ